MTLSFYLKYSSSFGQTLYVSGNIAVLGNDDVSRAAPLQYLNKDYWYASFILPDDTTTDQLSYKYILREHSGEEIIESCDDKVADLFNNKKSDELVLKDTWNNTGDTGNVFYTQPFQQILLPSVKTHLPAKGIKKYTHDFRIKVPLLKEHEVVCLSGSGNTLKNWDTSRPLLLEKKGKWWSLILNLSKENFPLEYKYGIYNTKEKIFVQFEEGNNRILAGADLKKKITILHDGFGNFSGTLWRGAGVAIPVFSLRSKNSFGTGEFSDIMLLTDWTKRCGMKLIQLLPLNDTTAHHSNKDSYPYAAISAFALHPLFINLDKIAGVAYEGIIKPLHKKQQQLNQLPVLDYEQVMRFKLNVLKELYAAQKDIFLDDTSYFQFFELNRHWLVPYAAFCYLRDKYKTADFTKWRSNNIYDENAIQRLVSPSQKHYDEIAVHYFTQYHLHLQLKEATAYAHKNGIIVKGDIPIGIYRNSVDAWMEPELYNMDEQAGAPPDDFAIKGQNWGFPTYNWKAMQENDFTWWRQRFEQMSNYFDAFRIDHILGFFRIWSIPLHAVQGIMGRFVPAIPVHINEFFEKRISYEWYRYCKPFITDEILLNLFGEKTAEIKEHFFDGLSFKPAFDTQHKIETFFSVSNDFEESVKNNLFDLLSNVILFEDDKKDGQHFHFRIGMEQTSSFAHLDHHSQQQLKELYINYFFSRQDDFWEREAMHKLPGLKRSTNMLICGEDLGMVPHCVPDVMKDLGILSLEIQRMPKKEGTSFFHPKDAPYMSVVTPSTHDMSTVRGWWEEDKIRTQDFYNTMLGHSGEAPAYAEPWINKEIILQHLYSPAMWSIFQLQDLLGMSDALRRENPADERINIPADPNHFWQYRMHLTLEDLLKARDFTGEIKDSIAAAGRA